MVGDHLQLGMTAGCLGALKSYSLSGSQISTTSIGSRRSSYDSRLIVATSHVRSFLILVAVGQERCGRRETSLCFPSHATEILFFTIFSNSITPFAARRYRQGRIWPSSDSVSLRCYDDLLARTMMSLLTAGSPGCTVESVLFRVDGSYLLRYHRSCRKTRKWTVKVCISAQRYFVKRSDCAQLSRRPG